MKVVEFTHAKGGVGCTTATVLYGLALARRRIHTHIWTDERGDDVLSTLGLPAGTEHFGSHLFFGREVNERAEVAVSDGALTPDIKRDHELLAYTVVDNTYLCLSRTMRLPIGQRGTELICFVNPERALTWRDVADTLDRPVVAQVPVKAAFARAVDAGLLAVSERSWLETAKDLDELTRRDVERTIHGVG